MRLHRLVLTNYRGISHREIEFPEHGVTVVSGANEAGKSSMIEALDLLLESKDRSTKKDVKQVKPTHADAGSEVTAEISTGAYRFIYRKRFHKKCETELTVLSPRREQLTGDEAHERVRAILDQTVDTGLWQAQRVMQSFSTAAVEVAGCDALSRALDVAAGDAAGMSGTEPLLVEKIDAEYGRYFTATGKPTGEWAAATKALQAAEEAVAQCAQALAEVDEKTRLHARLTAELAEVTAQLAPAAERCAAAEKAAARIAELRDQLRTAEVELAAARATEVATSSSQRERLRLRADLDARTAAVTAAAAAAAEAAEAEAVGREMVATAERAAAAAAAELDGAQERADSARRTVTQLADRDEADKLAARLTRIDGVTREHAQVCTQLASITLTEKGFRAIERAAAAVDVVRGQVELIAPHVEVTAESAVELTIGERVVVLEAGQSYRFGAPEITTLRLPGTISARIEPGATAAEAHTKLLAAQQHLESQLSQGGVVDVEQAHAVDGKRRELGARRDQLAATLEGLRGDDDVARLRDRLAELRANVPVEAGLWDLALDVTAARAELTAAEAHLTRSRAHCVTQQKLAAAAVGELGQRVTRTHVCQEKAAAARTELVAAQDRLTAQRTAVSDDEVAVQARAAADVAAEVAQRVTAMSARLAEAGPEAVATELASARAAAEELRHNHTQLTGALRDVNVELMVFGTEGRSGKLDAAQIRREHAASTYARVQSRARAADMLRSVMSRHRDTTRQRYVDPFRTEIERLGRVVFGPTFEVDIDTDLQIRNRTLDGRTVPYESLSGGAKEQLGIVARLAVAALVDTQDSVPVMIDDALGFTDPVRLTKMCEVLDVAGTNGQVIVLTCMPDRYRGVECAHHIEVTA
ncbi:AAA family ATPase [Mycolicibacterium mengxianglii]|uniref:AAA family ATPase n=1 Tax=Mycolicibacterium mengxianglii TaxID=2736649 RepID=UPI0018EEF5CD|nr:ATP-binding protein [Mycolicibacterium mengxianglii]